MTSLKKVLQSSTYGIKANLNENAITVKINEVTTRGLLSVTVISAQDLPALDFIGKSDPYVVLTQRRANSKAIIAQHKTRVRF